MAANEISVNRKYHQDIIKIWNKIKSEKTTNTDLETIFKRGLYAQDTLYKNGILFLGIGASFDEEKDKTVVEIDNVQYETIRGREKYAYYKKMTELAKATGFENNCSNIDITLFRETAQKKLEPFFKKHPELMQAQLCLAMKMMKEIKPKVIVASNALVRRIIKDKEFPKIESGLVFDMDEKTIERYGTPIIQEPAELKGTPIFFTSMLSGQHALDKGSFDRLVWHINWLKK